MGHYLENDENIQQHFHENLFLGEKFVINGIKFNSGGGYVFNQKLLKNWGKYCMDFASDVITSEEDVKVAQCLNDKINVQPFDTIDKYGRRYFSCWSMGGLKGLNRALYKDFKIVDGKKIFKKNMHWYIKYTDYYPIPPWPQCCAPYP